MTGEIEAAGDAITGGMLARAVEPGHGEAHDAGHGGCLNCGAAINGNYCAQCGQAAHLHRSFGAIGHDLAHGVLHFEGKIWTTLPELALRPGHLTRRYIHGERAKFVSPFALFLFSAFLMYAIFSLTSHGPEAGKMVQIDKGEIAELKQEEAKVDAQIAKIEAKLAAPGLSAARKAALTENLVEAREERQGLTMASGLTDALRGEGVNGGVAQTVGTAISAAAKNPEFAYYKLKANAYKFSWALILISLPFIWLLFPFNRRYKMYDHAIYITYSIAFMSLLFSLSMVLTTVHATSGLVTLALLLFAIWHMYRQFKDAYALSRMGALWRLPLLYGFACVSLSLFFTFLVMMG
ncbi:DUF3667 domain-containing protein [Sphingobium cupriresistens]|uniref:DUF3667 domain-containing protein n=1 Tax=Sphingobium cupriresistens TaxID=1132417 RepID=A0A8G1ZJ91_9SPHN|nr:DUF3667 domain-containing protein [Sphingobium cupriresistens]RYM14623.1 DUF3667 domain-containing protein [Sphingobium cupriresistens]